jgi:hypothetical protein
MDRTQAGGGWMEMFVDGAAWQHMKLKKKSTADAVRR